MCCFYIAHIHFDSALCASHDTTSHAYTHTRTINRYSKFKHTYQKYYLQEYKHKSIVNIHNLSANSNTPVHRSKNYLCRKIMTLKTVFK